MKKLIYLEDAIDAAIEAADDWDGGCSKERDRFIRDALEELPSAQSKNEERMEKSAQYVPNDDFISRKRAIDAIEAVFPVAPMKSEYAQGIACGAALSKTYIEQLPSVQSEIIRCKDCKWFGKAGCAVEIVDDSDKPTEDDYCSSAERRTDEQT